jgi:hypothetical protein
MKRQLKKEFIPLIDFQTDSSQPISKNNEKKAHCKGVDKVHPVNYTVEHVTNLPFQIITAYDSSGAVTALGGLIVQLNLASDSITKGPLSEEITLLVLGVRIALTLANVAAESIEEQERHETEIRRKKKVDARYRAMCLHCSELLNSIEVQLKDKTKPNWSAYNAMIFSAALSLYSQENVALSEQDEHLFYSALQFALPAEKQSEVFHSLRKFKKHNTERSRIALEEAVIRAFEYRVKPAPIIKNKKLRSLLRNLKRVLDFLLANATGISLVTIFASYIAVLPFISVVLFPVYIAAVSFGLVFAMLKISRDIIDHKHERFATKSAEQKSRYKQSRSMKKLLNHLLKTSPDEYLPSEQDSAQNSAAESNDESWPTDTAKTLQERTCQKQPWSEGGSLLLRTLITLPMTAAIGAISGWWAVITVSGIVTALGGPALGGAALMFLPPISAGIVAIYFTVKSFANHYRDYHLEQEDIKAITKEWETRQQRQASNKKLRNVSALADAELLETYINEYLRQVDPGNPTENSKEFFHNIQQMIGVKFSEAKDSSAFYSYLATKVLNGPSNDKGVQIKALELVSQLKAHMETIDLALLSENSIIEKNRLFIKIKNDRADLEYTLINPQGKIVRGIITREELPGLVPSLDLASLKTQFLPKILEITYSRGHTIHGKNKPVEWAGIDKDIKFTRKFIKKSPSTTQKFKSGFDSFTALISPVASPWG